MKRRKQICGQVAHAGEPFVGTDDGQKNLLHHVLGILAGSEDSQRHPVHRGGKAVVERRERPLVAGG